MGSGNNKREGVKIVQIETRYVETDAMNFRDVVQSLTGKNSSTDWVGSGGSNKVPRGNSVKTEEFQFHDHGVVARGYDDRSNNNNNTRRLMYLKTCKFYLQELLSRFIVICRAMRARACAR